MATKDNLWEIEEIVDIILRFLPGRYVAIAAQVCRLWREVVERIRRSRRECVVYLSPSDSNVSEDVLDFMKRQLVEPRAVLFFLGERFPSSSGISIGSFFQSIQNCLPVNCPFIGCTGHGVIGSGKSAFNQFAAYSEDFSLMMFPRFDGLEIRDFYVPLRKKHSTTVSLETNPFLRKKDEKIIEVQSFLPDMSLPVKLVIVLYHPPSFRKLTHMTLALRSKYGEDVMIVTGYSGCFLFYNSETVSGIIGLVLAGNLQCSSVVTPASTKVGTFANFFGAIQRLENCEVPKNSRFSLMFSCFSQRSMTYGLVDDQCLTFRQKFPDVPFAGFISRANPDMEKLKKRIEKLKKREKLKLGGRDFLHIDATVLCLNSLQ